jgi:hypothetical protein
LRLSQNCGRCIIVPSQSHANIWAHFEGFFFHNIIQNIAHSNFFPNNSSEKFHPIRGTIQNILKFLFTFSCLYKVDNMHLNPQCYCLFRFVSVFFLFKKCKLRSIASQNKCCRYSNSILAITMRQPAEHHQIQLFSSIEFSIFL